MGGVLTGGLLAVVLLSSVVYDPSLQRPAVYAVFLPYLLVVVLYVMRPLLSYPLCSTGLVVTFHAMAIISMIALGFDTGPILVAAMSSLLTGVFFDERWAGVSAVGLGAVVAWIGAAVHPGALPWYISAVGFVAVALLINVLTAAFVRIIEHLTDEKASAADALNAEKAAQRSLRSDLKEAQKALIDAKRFEVIGRVAGGMAHEFNNQLQIIISWSSVLLSEGATDNQRKAASRVRQAAQDASALTRSLLTVTRREQTPLKPVNVNQRLADWSVSWRQLVSNEIGIDLHLEDAIPLVLADPKVLGRALLNLIKNAAEALIDRGTITITVRSHLRDPLPVEIVVEDDGPGIDEDTQRQVFDAFYTTKGEHGTGLGLSIVRGTIEQMGGTVSLDSVFGQGTRVTLRLRAIQEPISHSNGSSEEHSDMSSPPEVG